MHFCRQADLEKLIPRRLHRPVNFNPEDKADISRIHYEENPLDFTAKHRKGHSCSISTATSRANHVQQALKLEFPPPKAIPMPEELAAALEFTRASDEKAISSFW